MTGLSIGYQIQLTPEATEDFRAIARSEDAQKADARPVIVGKRGDPMQEPCKICSAKPGNPCTNMGSAGRKGRLTHRQRGT